MPDRTILLKGLNIYSAEKVSVRIQALGNRSVGMKEAATVHDCFTLFAGAPHYEKSNLFSLHYDEFDLSKIEVSEPTLENYLDGFFASLLKEAAGIPVRLKMAVSFSYQHEDSDQDGVRIVLPVTIVPPLQIIPENGVSLPVISALAGQINDWTIVAAPVSQLSTPNTISVWKFTMIMQKIKRRS